jgi:transcription elongation factor Elf1
VNFPFYQHHRCPFCGAADALSEDILVKAAVVVLTWRCAACEAEWQPRGTAGSPASLAR